MNAAPDARALLLELISGLSVLAESAPMIGVAARAMLGLADGSPWRDALTERLLGGLAAVERKGWGDVHDVVERIAEWASAHGGGGDAAATVLGRAEQLADVVSAMVVDAVHHGASLPVGADAFLGTWLERLSDVCISVALGESDRSA